MGWPSLTLVVAFFLMMPGALSAKTGDCHCAAFKSSLVKGQWPIISITPFLKVACDTKGSIGCKDVCTELATTTWHKTPGLMCEVLKGDVEMLQPSVFFRSCENTAWEYTDLTSTKPFCCRGGMLIECKKHLN